MTLFEKSTSMQIISFPPHYQSVYTNFDISSFSLISCRVNTASLPCKHGEFASLFASNEALVSCFWIIHGQPASGQDADCP